MNKLEKCIDSLKKASGKPNKFEALRKKAKDRFMIQLAIEIDTIEGYKIGFDNHKNHQRPHVHIQKGRVRISYAIDTGEQLNGEPLPKKEHDAISGWILTRKDCLEFIYSNTQNCRSKEDFEPMIDAMKKHIN